MSTNAIMDCANFFRRFFFNLRIDLVVDSSVIVVVASSLLFLVIDFTGSSFESFQSTL